MPTLERKLLGGEDKYRILCKLQEGAHGTVYLAEDIHSQQRVAIKQISTSSKASRQAFLKEVEIATAVSPHDCIITTMDTTCSVGIGSIVMPLIPHDLVDWLPSKRHTRRSLCKFFFQICQAIGHLHSLRIAHLDIKLENILVDSLGNALLCDFGSAHYFDDSLEHPVGTVLYWSPEKAQDTNFDKAAADVWSLGILFYVLLTKSYPCVGTTEDEVINTLKNGKLSFHALESSKCSAAAKNLIHSMLQIQPSQRATIADVLRDPFFAQL